VGIALREIGSKGIAVPEAVVAAQTRPRLSDPRDASDPMEFIAEGREESETVLGIICRGIWEIDGWIEKATQSHALKLFA